MSLAPAQSAVIREYAQQLAAEAPPLTEEAQRVIRRVFAESRTRAVEARPVQAPAGRAA